jgi:hypothetical protein
MSGRAALNLILTIVHCDATICYRNEYPLLHLLGVNEIRHTYRPPFNGRLCLPIFLYTEKWEGKK